MELKDAVAVRLEGSNPACPVRKEVHPMRAARILTGAVLATAAAALPVASAAAAPGDVRVLPDRVHQYQQVDVAVTGCAEGTARGTSDADGPFTLSPQDGAKALIGHFTVAGWTEPGTHQVAVTCDGHTRTSSFVVAERGQTSTDNTLQENQQAKQEVSQQAKQPEKQPAKSHSQSQPKAQDSRQLQPQDSRPDSQQLQRQDGQQFQRQDSHLQQSHGGGPQYPHGGSHAGIGGSVGTDTATTATGAALLATASAAGVYMLRRRAKV
jgi:hypothetical protein